MKRPLWLAGLCFLLAIRVAFLFLPNTAIVISLILFALGLALYVLKSARRLTLIVIVISASIGFAVTGYFGYNRILPFVAYKNSNVKIEGIIEEVRINSARSVRYTVMAEFPELELPKSRIILRDYIAAELQAGQSIATVVKFGDPKYETTQLYYNKEGIPGEGILLEQPQIIPTAKNNIIKQALIKYRGNISQKIRSNFSPETAALVNSMAFGQTDDLDSVVYSALNRTGIVHIISVSGMHLSLFTGFVFWALSFLNIKDRYKYIFSLLAAFGFAMLVGLSGAIVRALVMTTVYLFGKIIGRQSDSLNSLGFSALIIGLAKPQWVLSLGLWLSVLATAGIIIMGVNLSQKIYVRLKAEGRTAYNKLVLVLSSSIGVGLGAYIFTLPLLIVSFGWVSVVSPLTNILVAPFAAVVVILGLLVAALPTNFPFYPIIAYVLELSSKTIITSSQLLARISFAAFSFDHTLLVVAVLTCAAVTAWFIAAKKSQTTALLLSISLILFSASLIVMVGERGYIQVTSLPDNQLVIIKEQSAVVVSKGDSYSANHLLDYLDYKNIKTIDALICLDYDGGATELFKPFIANYNLACIIGPNDSYSLNMLAQLAAGVPVYSSGEANLAFFEIATATLLDDEIAINIGEQKILLSSQKYDIIGEYDKDTLYFLQDRQIVPHNTVKRADPLGERIYKSETYKF